jgi:diguanylate cyclase (GGDEF)-like protein
LDQSLIPLVLVAAGLLVALIAVWLFIRTRDANGSASLSPATAGMGAGLAATSTLPAGSAEAHMGGGGGQPVAPEEAATPEVDEATVGVSPDVLIDPLTGLGSSTAWDFAIRHEEARFARYKEPATVVVAELEGYEMLAERLGREAADRLITPIANTLLRNSRRADRVARVGPVRFHVLLPKTDEITAINYVDRVRDETDDWLAAGAVSSRLVIGWASPGTGTSFADAMRVAEERMNADRRQRNAGGT